MKPILKQRLTAWEQATADVEMYGGEAADYLPIHLLLDSVEVHGRDIFYVLATHNSWFLAPNGPLARCFPEPIGPQQLPATVIGINHVEHEFGCVPTAQDYLVEMQLQPWMSNGRGEPPSYRGLRPRVEDAAEATHEEIVDDIVDGYTRGGKKYIIAD